MSGIQNGRVIGRSVAGSYFNSATTVIKLPPGHDILMKKNNNKEKKEKCDFFENYFFLDL